jgi:signal transduction histidine kinase
MRERAALVGGRVQIISSPNKGTTVEVFLPLFVSDEVPQSPGSALPEDKEPESKPGERGVTT